jgi:hypothetical protein
VLHPEYFYSVDGIQIFSDDMKKKSTENQRTRKSKEGNIFAVVGIYCIAFFLDSG